ncbi:hypothetical protein DAMA08_049640 [Martiniozyma asiatica (nom. inval.)]|nr:hypothetical protein DAMA08_049640 [Martiniozyma asiatica]
MSLTGDNCSHESTKRRSKSKPKMNIQLQSHSQQQTFYHNGVQMVSVPLQSPVYDSAYTQRMLPTQIVMGSPFYQSFDQYTFSPLHEKFKPSKLRNASENSMSSSFGAAKNLKSKLLSSSEPLSPSTSPVPENEDVLFSTGISPLNSNTSILTKKEDNEEEIFLNGTGKEKTKARENEANLKELDEKSVNSRVIKFLNLSKNITPANVLSIIQMGPVENCHCDLENVESITIFVSFVSISIANQCYRQLNKIFEGLKERLESPHLEITLSEKDSLPISRQVKKAIQIDGATRTICISKLPMNINKQTLLKELGKFGEIECIRHVVSKNAAFISYFSIANSMKCVDQLPLSDSFLSSCKIFYSSDSLGYYQSSQLHKVDEVENEGDELNFKNNEQDHGEEEYSDDENFSVSSSSYSPLDFQQFAFAPPNTSVMSTPHMNPLLSEFGTPIFEFAPPASPFSQSFPVFNNNSDSRTVFIGNLSLNVNVEDVCNVLRGGILEKIDFLPEKRIAFAHFIDADNAKEFVSYYTTRQLFIKNKRVRVGWGHSSFDLPQDLREAVDAGASRNMYIGLIDELEDEYQYDIVTTKNIEQKEKKKYKSIPDEETLRKDFSYFGQIEQINFFKDHRCAFINFTDIEFCIKCVTALTGANSEKTHESLGNKYVKFKISYGKDRCGNPIKNKNKNKNFSAKGSISRANSEQHFNSLGIRSSISNNDDSFHEENSVAADDSESSSDSDVDIQCDISTTDVEAVTRKPNKNSKITSRSRSRSRSQSQSRPNTRYRSQSSTSLNTRGNVRKLYYNGNQSFSALQGSGHPQKSWSRSSSSTSLNYYSNYTAGPPQYFYPVQQYPVPYGMNYGGYFVEENEWYDERTFKNHKIRN